MFVLPMGISLQMHNATMLSNILALYCSPTFESSLTLERILQSQRRRTARVELGNPHHWIHDRGFYVVSHALL